VVASQKSSNMMMRKIPAILTIAMVISSCNCNNHKSDKKEDEVVELDSTQTAESIVAEDSATIFDNSTRQWLGQSLQQTTLSWDRFKLVSFWAEDSLLKTDTPASADFYSKYASVLRWSPDSTYVLDIGSYGAVLLKNKEGKEVVAAGEPDSEVSLLFPKENKKTRVLFGGPSLHILNASWADSSQVAMLGSLDTSHTGHPDTLLWLIDVKEHFFRKYKWQ
jgi:hypothetical protein